jgi:hypothetical protein
VGAQARVGEAQRNAPARLGLLVLRKGSRPDRGGESASGSTSDSSRHDPPILASRLGQVKASVMFHVKQSLKRGSCDAAQLLNRPQPSPSGLRRARSPTPQAHLASEVSETTCRRGNGDCLESELDLRWPSKTPGSCQRQALIRRPRSAFRTGTGEPIDRHNFRFWPCLQVICPAPLN